MSRGSGCSNIGADRLRGMASRLSSARPSWRQQGNVGAPQRHIASRAAAQEEIEMSADELKGALLDSFWGIDRGLSATADTRADINELISQLEAKSPCQNPTETADKIGGVWKLAYTANSELVGLLGLNNLPLVTIGDIKQRVDPAGATVVNTVDVALPGSRTSLSSTAAVTVQSPKRFNIKFEKGTIATPTLLSELDIPDSTPIMGQNVDLRGLKSAIQPVQEASRGFVEQVASFVSRQPDLNIPISSRNAETWLITTYLDDHLRISRGDSGSVFVLTKESSVPAGGSAAARNGNSSAYAPAQGMASREANRPQDPADMVRDLGNQVSSALGQAANDPGGAARAASREASSLAQRAANVSEAYIEEGAAELTDAVRSGSSQANRAVQQGVTEAEGVAEDPAQAARDASREANKQVQSGVSQAEGVAEDPAQAVRDASREANKQVQSGVSQAESVASDPAQVARDAAQETDKQVQQTVSRGQQAAMDAQRAANDPAQAARNASAEADRAVQQSVTEGEKALDERSTGNVNPAGGGTGKAGFGNPSNAMPDSAEQARKAAQRRKKGN